MKTTRILVATGPYPPEIGGPATHAVMMERELPRFGFKVTVLPFSAVRRLPKGLRHLFYFFKCFKKALRHDLIFAQDIVSAGFPAALAALFTTRPFVVRVPGDYAWEQARQRLGVTDSIDDFQHKTYGGRVWLLRKVQNFVVRQADIVITPSDYFKQLVAGWIRDHKKIKTVYNGINLGDINQSPVTSRQLRIIVSAGRLVPWKGFGGLIEAVESLPEWRLIIIGDGPEYENLKLQIAKHKLQGRVELTGKLSRQILIEYLSAATIFALNTSFESFSFQTIEAMAAGLPVVVTNIGSLPEIVEDGKSGILVEPDNKDQFIEAITKIGGDKDLRQKLSKGARERSRRFSVERTVPELVKILKDLA